MTNSKKIVRIFQNVVTDNIDDENSAVYVDPVAGLAYGGHRRTWGIGDLIVRYRGEIDGSFFGNNSGVYHYPSNSYFPLEGLPGRILPQGGRELLPPDVCEDIFNNTFNVVQGYHQLVINPKSILDFIEEATMTTGTGEKVLNLEPFEVVNRQGHFAGQVDEYDGEMIIGITNSRGHKIPLFIDAKNSWYDYNKLRIGEWMEVAPVGIVEGKKLVKIMRPYEPGIKIAIQGFRGGLLMPGDPRYSVIPGESGNDIRAGEARTLPFIEGQERLNLRSAPLISIQLDTLVRALEPLSEYKRVQLMYKDSHTIALLTPILEEGEAMIDVSFSPMSTYVSGKVVTI